MNPTAWPQEHPSDPQPDRWGLYHLCGALPPGADEGPCCALPLGHTEPHETGADALNRWLEAHRP